MKNGFQNFYSKAPDVVVLDSTRCAVYTIYM